MLSTSTLISLTAFLIKPLMTIFGLCLALEFVFTVLTPRRKNGSPLIALLTLLPPCTRILLTLLWYTLIWAACTTSFVVRAIVYKQKPTPRFALQQYHSYKRDLEGFATAHAANKPWSFASISDLITLAIRGPSDM
ncbi:hypothetical protein M409DRAFT_22911 [Zasmidium cellare ATCC 36951]|uniref:Uncharacterized protein n=1 Tax=Zasmidium cellare ATCC 36951 TaxID=1080233 RepID=A0A6A6CKW7_ZASCE|nr:uncharacterized protein M409DRAFT_22911 [Zasmidium cellare ATCC 36951]KAF2166858.1 hypothetical protein M409DRAFT_22911 [Zasmidium cellare ATCC 36951]